MNYVDAAKDKVKIYWQPIEETVKNNQAKVLNAFQKAEVAAHCFTDSTGYGYHDLGRDSLEKVYAIVFKAETALVRPQIVSGTHAISLCLSILKPGEQLISLSGTPYDTLQQVIGTKGNSVNSLLKRGIVYREIPLNKENRLDYDSISNIVNKRTKMVMIQRSPGYSWRPAVSIDEIERAFAIVKTINPDCICFVDNCYGEFVEEKEPSEVGANLTAGSLIKNPGGGLAPSGGYIVGAQDLIEQCGEYLTAPGIGIQIGPTFNMIRPLLHGFFIAPHVVGQALRGAILAAQVFMDLGYPVLPLPNQPRSDIIQAIELGEKEKVLVFCREIQKASPVDSIYTPIPDQMPGYDDEIVMAGGTFIQGSSIELTADAPLRKPYIVYLQGGMGIEHIEIALEAVIQAL